MNIVLLKSVDNLGQAGEQVSVKRGYYRNFLEPRGYALTATKQNLLLVTQKRRKLESMVALEKNSATEIKNQLDQLTLTFELRAGEKGQLFGSVTSADVVAGVKEQLNIAIERRKVDMPHLKTLGEHEVRVRVYPGVTAGIKVVINKLVVEGESDELARPEEESLSLASADTLEEAGYDL